MAAHDIAAERIGADGGLVQCQTARIQRNDRDPGVCQVAYPQDVARRFRGLLCGFLGLLCDDRVFNFVVGGLGNDFLLHQFIFSTIGAGGDYFCSERVADAGKHVELIFCSRVDVQSCLAFAGADAAAAAGRAWPGESAGRELGTEPQRISANRTDEVRMARSRLLEVRIDVFSVMLMVMVPYSPFVSAISFVSGIGVMGRQLERMRDSTWLQTEGSHSISVCGRARYRSHQG